MTEAATSGLVRSYDREVARAACSDPSYSQLRCRPSRSPTSPVSACPPSWWATPTRRRPSRPCTVYSSSRGPRWKCSSSTTTRKAGYPRRFAVDSGHRACPASGAEPRLTGGVNLAAGVAAGDWLFLLNPDATAEPACLALLLEAGAEPATAIVGAQVLLPDGHTNAGDNPVNIAGLSWSGRYGQPREHGPARDTAAVSGAALMVRRDVFDALGGLCPYFFLYQDDADLAWRVRLAGWRVRFAPPPPSSTTMSSTRASESGSTSSATACGRC